MPQVKQEGESISPSAFFNSGRMVRKKETLPQFFSYYFLLLFAPWNSSVSVFCIFYLLKIHVGELDLIILLLQSTEAPDNKKYFKRAIGYG